MFDVGGQRIERRKWIQCFNGMYMYAIAVCVCVCVCVHTCVCICTYFVDRDHDTEICIGHSTYNTVLTWHFSTIPYWP